MILGFKIAEKQSNVCNEKFLYKMCLKMKVWKIVNTSLLSS